MRYFLAFALCATLFVSSVFAAPYWQYRFLESDKNQPQKLKAYQRILKLTSQKPTSKKPAVIEKDYTLIIAPHPDDEILCCTSVIREAVKNNDPLKIIYLTDGDALSNENPAASRAYGKTRRGESVKALAGLGVQESDLIWLGFPDSILGNLRLEPIVSPFTFRKKTAANTYVPDLDYTRENLDEVLRSIIKEFPPVAIYFPDENKEKHADHITAGKVIWNLIEPVSETFHHYRYAIHDKNFRKDPDFYDAEKAKAIQAFQSQFHDESHVAFLLRFAYKQELFQ